jgi:hypothetical protein
MARNDTAGRVIGLIVFVIGIAILILVATLAYRFFSASTSHIVVQPANGTNAPVANRLGESVMKLLYQIALLMVMAIAGSLTAARGLHLYLGSSDGRRHSVNSAPPD